MTVHPPTRRASRSEARGRWSASTCQPFEGYSFSQFDRFCIRARHETGRGTHADELCIGCEEGFRVQVSGCRVQGAGFRV